MLRASQPSRSTRASAASTMRSSDSFICVHCIVRCTLRQPMQPIRQYARPLAWAAIAGQLALVAAWIVAGALEPRYSHVEHYVSVLGANGAAKPWIVNAGLVVAGPSLARLGAPLVAPLPPRPPRPIAPP